MRIPGPQPLPPRAPSRATPPARTGPLAAALRTPHSALRVGFTLLELLVVIVIIGILATLGLPAIKGMTKSNSMAAANRQLLDDLHYARQRAINDHTTVYVVFIGTNVVSMSTGKMNSGEMSVLTNLYGGQYTTYALLSLRSVGDQPGVQTPHYLTAWRTLPGGVFIAQSKFTNAFIANVNPATEYLSGFAYFGSVKFPFPVITSLPQSLPYLAFDYLGRTTNNVDIPLARGSIFYAQTNGAMMDGPADVQETPANNSITLSNVIHIDGLTGHASVQRQEIQ